jgi:hypothetical protein
MARFDDARRRVKVDYVLVGSGVSEKNTSEVVPVKFGASRAGEFDTHPGPKHLEVGDVRLTAMPTLERSLLGCGVNETVVEVCSM